MQTNSKTSPSCTDLEISSESIELTLRIETERDNSASICSTNLHMPFSPPISKTLLVNFKLPTNLSLSPEREPLLRSKIPLSLPPSESGPMNSSRRTMFQEIELLLLTRLPSKKVILMLMPESYRSLNLMSTPTNSSSEINPVMFSSPQFSSSNSHTWDKDPLLESDQPPSMPLPPRESSCSNTTLTSWPTSLPPSSVPNSPRLPTRT